MRLKRSDHHDLEPTVLLRPFRSNGHEQFEKLLPWFTPILVYRMDDEDWVRWHVPHTVAEDVGIAGGCACCGSGAVEVENGFHVDTSWPDVDWWLLRNGYELPPYGVADRNIVTPQEEGKKK